MSGEKGIVLRNGRFAAALNGVVETLGPVMGPKVAAVLREAKEAIEKDQDGFERTVGAKVAAIEERVGTGIHVKLVQKAELTIKEIRERIERVESGNGAFRERLGAEVTEFMNALATGLKFSRDQAYVDGVQANRKMEEAAKALKAAEVGLTAKEVELVGLRSDVQEMREMILGLNAIVASFVEGSTENAPAVRAALEAIEKSLLKGQKTRDELLETGREVRAQLAKLIDGIPKGNDEELRREVAVLREELETMKTRKAVDAEGAAAVETHEREARTSEPPEPEAIKAAQKAERRVVLGKLADALTEDRDSAILKGLVAISNDHLDGIQSVLEAVGVEAGKLNESAALKEALGRLFAGVYDLDYDNMDNETTEKLNAKVERAIKLLERHLSHATTAEADATAVEREEARQVQEISPTIEKFMDKLGELVGKLNVEGVMTDELASEVSSDPKVTHIGELTSELIEGRLAKVAKLMLDDGVLNQEDFDRVTSKLKLGTNGNLATSLQSELQTRIVSLATSVKGIIGDEKFEEVVNGSW